MQQQQTVQQQFQMQERLRQAHQAVTDKLQQFKGRDISKFCRLYEQLMEDNGIQDQEVVDDGFHLIVIPRLRARIKELQAHQGADWQEFKKALKEEYFLEGSQRVTKQSFMKWINQRNKGLSVGELLWEFEKKYDQLFAIEQQSIRAKWVELVVQAVDARLQKSLEHLLEDASRDVGLTVDWKLVPDAVSLIVKRQMQVDNLIMAVPSETSDEEIKDKPATFKQKLKEPILDDLVKDLKKLFEERILNSKVEMTLGDILGIANRELHQEIINIIKQKMANT
ncbi:hypothetical protein L7F22_043326 [Adiantum nelumboides]|nr:hypothetical protein [Adiantum nelumboides]